MTVKKEKNSDVLTVSIEGRLDTTTAPELEAELKGALDGIAELVLDVSAMDYISSAGLRVLLSAQKTMNRQGEMKVTGVSEMVMEIFDVTGFSSILNIV